MTRTRTRLLSLAMLCCSFNACSQDTVSPSIAALRQQANERELEHRGFGRALPKDADPRDYLYVRRGTAEPPDVGFVPDADFFQSLESARAHRLVRLTDMDKGRLRFPTMATTSDKQPFALEWSLAFKADSQALRSLDLPALHEPGVFDTDFDASSPEATWQDSVARNVETCAAAMFAEEAGKSTLSTLSSDLQALSGTLVQAMQRAGCSAFEVQAIDLRTLDAGEALARARPEWSALSDSYRSQLRLAQPPAEEAMPVEPAAAEQAQTPAETQRSAEVDKLERRLHWKDPGRLLELYETRRHNAETERIDALKQQQEARYQEALLDLLDKAAAGPCQAPLLMSRPR